MKKIKKVNLKYGTRTKLATLFNVSVKTISSAVQGHSNTELSKKIRAAAVKMGGDPIYK